MVIYGAGGHGMVLLEAIEATGKHCKGVFDDGKPTAGQLFSTPILGKYSAATLPDHELLMAIGDNELRQKLVAKVRHPFGRLFHPQAYVSPNARILEGTVVLVRAVVQPGVNIGRHVIVNTGAIIEHHCKIDDYVQISPGAVLQGAIAVGQGTLIGPGVIIEKGVHVGQWCILAAGSVISTDVPDHSVVKGVPGKVVFRRK
jgi:sugar O-acyltransferase (sialic acid O-acetyltransferase NeuD family)